MSNVKFLRGLQSNLDKLTSFKEGAFYLTSDTNRLYFAQSADKLAHLNQYVIQVADMAALPVENAQTGDFYYILSDNILCTKLSDGTWQQINADTNDFTYIDSVNFNPEVVNGNIKVAYTIDQKVKDKTGTTYETHPNNQTFEGSFEITKDMIGQVQVSSNVDVKASTKDSVVYVKPDGVGASTDTNAGFAVAGGDGIEVSTNEYGIVIEGQTYSLGSEANEAKIQLNDKNGTPIYEVEIVASENNDNIVIDGSQEGKVIVGHKDGFLGEFTSIVNNPARDNPKVTIITGFDLNNGHITDIKTDEVTLFADRIDSVDIDENNKLAIKVVDSDGEDVYSVSSTKKFGYTIGTDFVALDDDLNKYYYTISQIDDKFEGLNALTFKGEVKPVAGGTELILPSSQVQAGDVYIVTENGMTADGISAEIGDLFIAVGEENTDGFIVAPSWTHVPAGDEKVYTYSLSVDGTQNSIILADNADSTDSIQLSGDDAISVVASGNNGNKIQYSHAKTNPKTESVSNTNTSVNAGGTITAITEVNTNDFGHVTGCKTTTFEIPGDNTLAVENNNHIILKDSNGGDIGDVEIEGGALLTASSSDNKITINHDEVTTVKTTPEKSLYLSDAENDIILNVVDSIETDAYGHINAIQTSKVKLIPVNQFTKEITQDAATKDISIIEEVKDSDGTEVSKHTAIIHSESINMSLSNNIITAEIVWGTF